MFTANSISGIVIIANIMMSLYKRNIYAVIGWICALYWFLSYIQVLK